MRTGKPHGMRNAVLVALFLLVSGTHANRYMNESDSRGKNRVIAGTGSYGISRWIVEAPVFSFLPRWFLNRAAVPIAREWNLSVLKSVLEVFDPSLRSFLTSVPIILDSTANTAKAYRAKDYMESVRTGTIRCFNHRTGRSTNKGE